VAIAQYAVVTTLINRREQLCPTTDIMTTGTLTLNDLVAIGLHQRRPFSASLEALFIRSTTVSLCQRQLDSVISDSLLYEM